MKNNKKTNAGERTLIIAGSKSVGKSTMIHRFLERNEIPKETLALEYTFGRKSGRSFNKDVCHIWELGGGTLFVPLITAPLGNVNPESSLVIVVDLSSPQHLWHTIEIILQTVYNHLKKTDKWEELTKEAKDRLNKGHEDYQYLTPFPLPLVIIGGKYDIFENMDPEKRKLICRTLRQIAHSLSASLFFYSDKDPTLVKKLKDLFNFYGFGGSPWKVYSTDYSKPLTIAAGSDSFDQIATGVSSHSVSAQGLSILDRFKHAFTTHFPQEVEENNSYIPDDPAKDANFREPVIDVLRSQKDEELERITREIENRRRMALT